MSDNITDRVLAAVEAGNIAEAGRIMKNSGLSESGRLGIGVVVGVKQGLKPYAAKIKALEGQVGELTAIVAELQARAPITEDGGIWKTNALYKAGDVVTYQNSGFICKVEHVSGPSISLDRWRLFHRGKR